MKPHPAELSAEDAGKLLSTSSKTVRNLISRKLLRGKKVNGKWFIEHQSVLDYQAGDQRTPLMPKKQTSIKGVELRSLAAYRLCLHAFETFDWQHRNALVRERLAQIRLEVIGEIGSGYYQFGKGKQRHYKHSKFQ